MALINNEKYARYYHKLGVIYERPEMRASVEIIFSVFMVLLLIFTAIRPTLTNLVALQKRIADKESLDVKADKKIAQLFRSQEQLEQYKNSLRLYDSAVPDGFLYTQMIGRLEHTARKSGVLVENLSAPGIKIVGEGKPKGEWSTKLLEPDKEKLVTIPVDFQISGKPDQVRSFLIDVENMDRLTVVKSVNLIKESESTRGSEKIRASGQVNFYAYMSQ